MARILVVEDDAALSHILRMLLENEGHEVLVADDGIRGMATAQRRGPDVIICDLMMPTMDGFTFLEALREDPRTKETSVLVLTALDKEIAEERCYRLGVKVFIRKPFDAAILLGMLEELLESRDTAQMRVRFGITPAAPLAYSERLSTQRRRSESTSVSGRRTDLGAREVKPRGPRPAEACGK